MSWDKINVFQYQQMFPVLQEDDPLEQTIKLIAIVNGWTENQVNSLNIKRFNEERAKLSFLEQDIGGKPKKYLKIKNKRYKCVYDVRKLPSARYIESKVFSQDFVGNLHKIAASMVIPMKRTILGWREDKYDASKHEEYAQDMLEAKIQDIYQSVVFFYHVYRNWMEVSRDYLISKMKGMTREQAEKEVQNLFNILDGNIPPKLLPTSTISRIAKRMKSLS